MKPVMLMNKRHETRAVYVGGVQVGHQDKVVIQTMTSSKTSDTKRVVHEINSYATMGADIVRLAVLDMEDAIAIKTIKKETTVPLVADIHFDYRLALKAIENGIDKIRINPGNIGDETRVKAVVDACKEKNIPIRIGVNAGSLEKSILNTYGKTAEGMVESAARHVSILENLGFYDIIISLKASDASLSTEAYLKAAERFPYPLHLGVTEAGGAHQGVIASSAALGELLRKGIGDTIRISLSAPRNEEIKACKTLLTTYNLYDAPRIISCPTCGRLSYDMQTILKQVEAYLEDKEIPLTVAVMGCAVNGPGEAREADIGIAGGVNEGLIFLKGHIVKKVPQAELFETFKTYLDELINN